MTFRKRYNASLIGALSQQDNRTFIFKNGVYQIDAYAPIVANNIEISRSLRSGTNSTFSTVEKVELTGFKKMCIKYHFSTFNNPKYSYVRILLPKNIANNVNVSTANVNKFVTVLLSRGTDGVAELDVTEFSNEQYLGIALGVLSTASGTISNTVQISEWWLE